MSESSKFTDSLNSVLQTEEPWLPVETWFLLTKELIDKCRTEKDSFTRQTRDSLAGLSSYEDVHGKNWINKLVHKKIHVKRDRYIEIYRNKDVPAKNAQAKDPQEPSGLDYSKYKAYLKSAKWKRFSKTVKERDGNRCRVCNKDDILDVHHRNYDYIYKEDENDFADLTTLCRNCHNKHHSLEDPIKCPPSESLKAQCRAVLGVEAPVLDKPKDKEVEDMSWLPSSSSFTLTTQLINKLRTKKGGFSGKTLRSLGANIKKRGWKGRLVRKKRVVTKDWYIGIYQNKDILSTNSKEYPKRRRKRKKLA